jgi:hypothetical protein
LTLPVTLKPSLSVFFSPLIIPLFPNLTPDPSPLLHPWSFPFIYFLLWLFHLRWTLIQHFQVFHVNKSNTCFAVRVISKPPVKRKQTEHVFCCWSYLSKTTWRQSENTAMTRWRNEVGGIS